MVRKWRRCAWRAYVTGSWMSLHLTMSLSLSLSRILPLTMKERKGRKSACGREGVSFMSASSLTLSLSPLSLFSDLSLSLFICLSLRLTPASSFSPHLSRKGGLLFSLTTPSPVPLSSVCALSLFLSLSSLSFTVSLWKKVSPASVEKTEVRNLYGNVWTGRW